MKKFLTILICAILLLTLVGCGQNIYDGIEGDAVLATVNGVPITMEEFYIFYTGTLAEQGADEATLLEYYGAEQVQLYKNDVLEDLVVQELIMQYAASYGLDVLSEEDMQTIRENAQAHLDSIKEEITQTVQQEAAAGGVLITETAEVDKRYKSYLEQNDLSNETLENQLTRNMIFNRVYEHIMEGFTLQEEDIRAYYDENLQAQQETAEADPETALSMYLYGGNEVNLYVPESIVGQARLVKHILLSISEAYEEEIALAETAGDTELAHDLEDEALAQAKHEAEQVIEALDAGEDFDALSDTYNMDYGVQTNPDGYLVYEGAGFAENFLAEALALENVGDYSQEPVETEFGYHVLLYAADPEPGPVPYEDVKESIREIVESNMRYDYWMRAIEEMRAQANVTKTEFA